MGVPTAYLNNAKNTVAIMEAIQRAGVPERFTYEFLNKNLGFGSSSDRPHIPVLKALGFLTEAGVPTERYKRYMNRREAPVVMAEALREAYSDLFAANRDAHTLAPAELQGLFARLSGKGEAVTKKMVTTFRTFAELADFSAPVIESVPVSQDADSDRPESHEPATPAPHIGGSGVSVHHDIHVHLPVSTDIAVYDAIFRSLRQHLDV